MRLGTKMEPVVVSETLERLGRTATYPVPMYISREYPFIAASLDAQFLDGDEEPLETKTASWRRAAEFGEEGTDQIPEDYIVQVHQQMFVAGKHHAKLSVLLDGRTLKIYEILRNEEIVSCLIEAEKELWERICNSEPPEPNWQHPRTPELVKAMYGVNEGSVVLLYSDAAQSWDNYRALGEEIKALEEERESAKAKVLYAMGEAAIGVMPAADIELVRSTVNRKSYTVAETSYKTLRQRKVKSK
jgi:predicted phage-related endonuclease